jgi:two-component system chemotaxis response regulator CheB
VPDVVVIGGSAGGVEALLTLVERLPSNMPSSVLVVLHIPARFPSRLPDVVARKTTLDVAHASDGEAILPGSIRIAPPDRHLVVVDGRLALTSTPTENRHRPAIDALFRSAAEWYGPKAAAVVLSGAPGDGVKGLRVVQQSGGRVLVQDPTDAIFGALPESALDVVQSAEVGTAAEIGDRLVQLMNGSHDEVAESVGGVVEAMSLP